MYCLFIEWWILKSQLTRSWIKNNGKIIFSRTRTFFFRPGSHFSLSSSHNKTMRRSVSFEPFVCVKIGEDVRSLNDLKIQRPLRGATENADHTTLDWVYLRNIFTLAKFWNQSVNLRAQVRLEMSANKCYPYGLVPSSRWPILEFGKMNIFYFWHYVIWKWDEDDRRIVRH